MTNDITPNTPNDDAPSGNPYEDDARLTAYALGELDGSDRAEVEALMERDPAARAAVEAITGFAHALSGELAGELASESAVGAGAEAGASAGLSPEQKAAVLGAASAAQLGDNHGSAEGAGAAETLAPVTPVTAAAPWWRPMVRLSAAAAVIFGAVWLVNDKDMPGGEESPFLYEIYGDGEQVAVGDKREYEEARRPADELQGKLESNGRSSRISGWRADDRGEAGSVVTPSREELAQLKQLGYVGGGDDDAYDIAEESAPTMALVDGIDESHGNAASAPSDSGWMPLKNDDVSASLGVVAQGPTESEQVIDELLKIKAGETVDAATLALARTSRAIASADATEVAYPIVTPVSEPTSVIGTSRGKGGNYTAPTDAGESAVNTIRPRVSASGPGAAAGETDPSTFAKIGRRAIQAPKNVLVPTGDSNDALTALGYIGGADRDDGRGNRKSFDGAMPTHQQVSNETYAEIVDNDFTSPWDAPLSTFSVDVDTAAYANVRRFLNEGRLPPPDAVRIEELLNYFEYADPAPLVSAAEADALDDGEVPFAVHIESGAAPWAPEHRLVRVALKGAEVDAEERPAANLVFLLDVSGSMNSANKLPLLQQCMRLLTAQLDGRDRVAIVTYAGSSGIALPSTSGADKPTILHAIDRLRSGGSTNGAAGIEDAYRIAGMNFIEGGVNRVILGTDGDFNVGITQRDELERLISQRAASGVFLSVLGFGRDNLKDATVEMLADKGNGNYAYIDSLSEGRRVLVERIAGTLHTIAKDVKLQVEFNPGRVAHYRLIGYENRKLAARDFNDDRKDAGEIGAGHSVVALYEIVPPGVAVAAGVDALKYQQVPDEPRPVVVNSPELLTVKLRWKAPQGATSQLVTVPFVAEDYVSPRGRPRHHVPSADFRFSAAVAAFGMTLRNSPHKGTASMAMAQQLAGNARGTDDRGWRAEFIRLAEVAGALLGE